MTRLRHVLHFVCYTPGERQLMKTLAQIVINQEKLMSQVSEYVNSVEAKLTKIGTDLTSLSTQAAGLKSQITDLQTQLANAGNLSDDDKAAMEKLVADAGALADQADAASGNVTPPPAPEEPAPAPQQ